jgi:hypothetical protein
LQISKKDEKTNTNLSKSEKSTFHLAQNPLNSSDTALAGHANLENDSLHASREEKNCRSQLAVSPILLFSEWTRKLKHGRDSPDSIHFIAPAIRMVKALPTLLVNAYTSQFNNFANPLYLCGEQC